MNSIKIGGNCENNVSNINVSQCSGDLFQDSSQLECTIHSNFACDNNFSNEKSSETSDELCFTPRRKPRKALSFSHDSKKSSESLRNDSTTDSSKFFQPISPACKSDKIRSTSFLDVNHSSSSEACMTSGTHHLSKENVAVVSFVSESENSASSSILDDSLKSENDNKNSKQLFKTPICSSVKKRTIREWLNNVSLNCSHKPNENNPYTIQEVSPIINLSNNKNYNKPIGLDIGIQSVEKNNTHDVKSDLKEFKALNVSGTGDLCDNNKIEKSNSSENYCPWLLENRKNDNSLEPHETSYIHKILKRNKVVLNQNTSNFSQKSPDKSVSFKSSYKLSKVLDRSFQKDSERNISKRSNQSLIFNQSLHNYKSSDVIVLSADSDSSFNEIFKSNISKHEDSDDSFTKIRLSKKKKKKNCLNISSDDSEAKDTANESEDIPHHNNELCTPRRRLYFRNPLNNSLDDDAKPLTIFKDYSISSKDKSRFIEKANEKNTGLLDQLCLEVNNINDTPVGSVGNQDNSFNNYGDSNDVESEPPLLNESMAQDSDYHTQPSKELKNESDVSVSLHKSNSITHSPPGEQDDVNQINFGSLSLGNTTQTNSEKDYDNLVNGSSKHGYNSSSAFIDESQINDNLDSSNQPPNQLDESSDSIVNIRKKSKKNILNVSSDSSFISDKPNTNIIDVNEISDNVPNPLIDLTKSDDEYDKYMYRTRSDSSFSENEEIPGVLKDPSDVVSVHTTTSEDEENAPWFDLESYLKKNIPASSKSLDSSFIKNSDKRKARLAKISLPSHSSCPNHTSFLLSLTPEVPDEMCHPEAVKYRGESFSKHKNELVDLLFKLFNVEIFDEKLPPLEIKWSGHLTTTSGITKSSSKITKNGKLRNSIIKLSKTVVDDASKLRDVLLHELCHAANWLIDEQAGGHGPLFKKWVNKIWMKFPEVPRVKTTHHYELKWKYLYKCSYCGYELGKMKLSLNETSCRLCGGLVSVNT